METKVTRRDLLCVALALAVLVLGVGIAIGVIGGGKIDDRYRYNGTDFETFTFPGTTTPSP